MLSLCPKLFFSLWNITLFRRFLCAQNECPPLSSLQLPTLAFELGRPLFLSPCPHYPLSFSLGIIYPMESPDEKRSPNHVLPVWSKPIIVILLVVSLYFLGVALLSGVTSLLYNETLPFPSLNRILAGRDIHPLSHYLSYFLYLYRTAFLLLTGFVAYFVIVRPTAFSRRFPYLAVLLEALLVALLSTFVFSQRIPLKVGLYDEGLILTGAWQFSLGAIPYRDFYNIYGPGQVAVLGTLFALFGKSIFLAHLYDLAIRVAITLVIWGILRPLVYPMQRLFAHVAIICWLNYFELTLYPVYPTLLFQLATIFFLLLPSTRLSFIPRFFVLGCLLELPFYFDMTSAHCLLFSSLLFFGFP